MKKHQIAIFLAIVQGVLFLGHYLIYKIFFYSFEPFSPNALRNWQIFFFASSISFLTASIFTYKFYGAIGRTFYRLAAFFTGTMYWLLFASFFSGLAYIVNYDLGLAMGRILLITGIIISIYGLINSYNTRITRLNIKIDNLPEKWKNKKAVILADTHFGSFWNVEFAKKIVKMIAAENPDIVFFSGDFYDGPPAYFGRLAKPFTNLKIKDGIWFAPGNHEEFSDPKPFFDALKNAGIKVLNNEMLELDGMQIIGVGFGAAHRAEQEQGVLENLKVDKNKPSILLKHEPSHIEVAEKFNISLQLSGHTHFGQVWPLNLITKKVYGKFHHGLNSLGQTQVYTTTGAGAWGPPQRVGNSPEIVVINFQ